MTTTRSRSGPSEVRTPSVRVCVATPNLGAYSETFIHSHIDGLPGVERVISGGFRPDTDATRRRPLLPPVVRLVIWVLARLGVHHWSDELWDRAVARFLRRNGIDVVLAEYGPTGAALARACRITGVGLVVHFHGFDASDRPTLAEHSRGYAKMFRVASAVVAVSEDMRSRLLALGAPPEKLHLSPYGVDLDSFSMADPADAPPRLLSVGRFVEKKAPHLTLLALHRALQSEPSIELAMAGDGELLGACKHLVRALDIENHVRFLGVLAHAQVAQEMRSTRAFVQHSVVAIEGDSEGLPLAILEASASGLPVIATRHAGIPDAVLDGATGLLSEEDDIEAMAEHMVRLAREPDTAAAMGRRARERISETFTLDASLRRLHEIIVRTAPARGDAG